MPLTEAGIHQFLQGRFRILGRAVLSPPLLSVADRHRPALTFNPLDKTALVAVIIGLIQNGVYPLGLGSEPSSQPDSRCHAPLIEITSVVYVAHAPIGQDGESVRYARRIPQACSRRLPGLPTAPLVPRHAR